MIFLNILFTPSPRGGKVPLPLQGGTSKKKRAQRERFFSSLSSQDARKKVVFVEFFSLFGHFLRCPLVLLLLEERVKLWQVEEVRD